MEDRSTSVWVVGYPKTGNTWLRFMLGRCAQVLAGAGEAPLFDEVDRLGRRRRYAGLPALSFTHEPLVWRDQTAGDLTSANVTRPFAGRPVVLITRHPLDALVSNWFQETTRNDPPYAGTLEDFLADPVFGLEKLLRFHEIWRTDRRGDRLHLFRYEDARRDPAGALRGVLTFLGVSADESLVADAVGYGSFDNMRRMETSGPELRYRGSQDSVFATGDRANPDALHVRKGEVGGYRQHLAADVAAGYELRIAAVMDDWYGYGNEGDG